MINGQVQEATTNTDGVSKARQAWRPSCGRRLGCHRSCLLQVLPPALPCSSSRLLRCCLRRCCPRQRCVAVPPAIELAGQAAGCVQLFSPAQVDFIAALRRQPAAILPAGAAAGVEGTAAWVRLGGRWRCCKMLASAG